MAPVERGPSPVMRLIYTPKCFFRHKIADFEVMGLSRQFWKDLDLIGNTHGNPFRAAGQETIIESFALSQAVAVFRKGRTRNKDKVNILRLMTSTGSCGVRMPYISFASFFKVTRRTAAYGHQGPRSGGHRLSFPY